MSTITQDSNELNSKYKCRLEQIYFKTIFKCIDRNTLQISMGREFHNLGAHEEKKLYHHKTWENVFSVLRRSLSGDLKVCVGT